MLVVHSETLEELELLLCTDSEVIDEFELKLSRYEPMKYHHISLTGHNSELFITLVLKTKAIPPSVAPKMDVQVFLFRCPLSVFTIRLSLCQWHSKRVRGRSAPGGNIMGGAAKFQNVVKKFR